MAGLSYVGPEPTADASVVTKDWVTAQISSGGETTIVQGSVNGTPTQLTLWTGTAAQYSAVSPKVATTVYIVT